MSRDVPTRVEWAIGIVLAVAAVVLTAAFTRGMWFGSDELEYLTHRTAFDPGDLTRPIGGHWTTWSVLLLRGLYNAVGLDWWPWFILPRLIGHTALAVLVWYVVRRRGADAFVAMVALATILVLGVSGYQRALQIGNWAVYAALIVCAWIITERPTPTNRDRLVVGGVLLVGVLGNGYSVAVIGGITVALLLARRLVTWLPALVPALAVYVIWWLRFRGDIRPKPELTVGKILDIPANAFRVLRTAVEHYTGLPGALAAVIVLALLAVIVLLAVRRELDVFDTIVLATLGIGLCLLSVQRIAIDSESADATRYGYSVTVLLTLALVPHLHLPATTLVRSGVVVVGALLVAANVGELHRETELRVDNGRENEARYALAAELVDAGEPIVPGASTIGGGMETDELLHLLADGHHPDPLAPDDPFREQLEAEVRGGMRMNLFDRVDRLFDHQPGPVADGGCVTVTDEPVEVSVTEPRTIRFERAADDVLHLTWTDEFGVGTLDVDQAPLTRDTIALADPEGEATLELVSDGGDIRVCGLP